MSRIRFLIVLSALLSGCASPPPPKTEAMAEPKVAEDLPTWCSSDKKPCVPSRDFANRLCSGHFPSAALFLFQRESPWQRRWVKAKDGLPAKSTVMGPTGAVLEYAEELLVMGIDDSSGTSGAAPSDSPTSGSSKQGTAKARATRAAKDKAPKPPEPELLVLRWDGTCAKLMATETLSAAPAAPRHPDIDWTKIDPFVKRSLFRESEVQRASDARELACGKRVSSDCRKAEQTLSACVVKHIRRGTKLAMPEQRP